MPDETPTLELSPEQPNAAKHNAEVAAALKDQGREMQTTHIETKSLDTYDALRELRDKIVKEKADAVAKTDDEGGEAEPVVAKKEDAVPPPKEASDATIAPAKTDVTVEVKSDKPGALGGPDDIFSGISLPPNIKPKSAEAFAAVKSKALEEISARDAKLTELEKLVKELEEKTKQPADENLLKELEDLRTFRSKLDVEIDPRFKQFDKDIADTHNFVYSQLLKTGKITQENIDQIKKYGGPAKVNLEKIFEAINDPTVKRIIESKVADEEMLHFKKEQAIKETKENVAGYLKEREVEFSKATKSHNDATQKQFSTLVAKMEWVKEKPLPKDANDAVKSEVKSHNEFVASTKKDLEAALQDDSPEMRAILLAGMGQLLNLQRVHENVNKKLATAEKELAEVNAKLERIKGASKSRLPESSAPVGVKVPEKPKDDFSTPTIDALENARKQIMAERAAKAAV